MGNYYYYYYFLNLLLHISFGSLYTEFLYTELICNFSDFSGYIYIDFSVLFSVTFDSLTQKSGTWRTLTADQLRSISKTG